MDFLWSTERTFIVAADTEGGSCEGDRRGPWEARVCLPERSGKVSYIYRISQDQEGKKSWHVDQLFEPSGSKNLSQTFDLEDAVRGSLRFFDETNNSRLDDMTSASVGSLIRKEDNNKDFAGYWTIPVCEDPEGFWISSIDNDDGRNYPCMCGTSTADQGYFLDASHLKYSYDFYRFCGDGDKIWGGRKPTKCKTGSDDLSPYYRSKDEDAYGVPEANKGAKVYMSKAYTTCKELHSHKTMFPKVLDERIL